MWESRRLTTLWASAACYRDRQLYPLFYLWHIRVYSTLFSCTQLYPKSRFKGRLTYLLSCLLDRGNWNLNSLAWVRERTIPTERPPLVGEVSANFVDRECHVVSVTDPHGRNLEFLYRSRYFFFQVAPQLYSRGWVDPVPDPLLRKSGSARNRTRTSGSVTGNSDH
jgi:hypothetical protein